MAGPELSDSAVDVAAWRKAERARLIASRLAVPAAQRTVNSERIAETLLDLIGDARGKVVSGYWPFRGEPELLPVLRTLSDRGARAALPVVIAKGQPLVFREWKSGDRLEHGVWKIPIPANGAEVMPDIVIAPVVGFDPDCYRLGYGGGFFDRTLAAMETLPTVFGVGYAMAAIPTIHPQPYDIPMSTIITEDGVMRATAHAG